MTDSEIIKALEKLLYDFRKIEYGESICDLIEQAVNIIKCKDEQINGLIAGQETLQKHLAEKNAEIEKKNTEIDILIRKKGTLRDEISELNAEIERLKGDLIFREKQLDNLVKEMEGANEKQ